MSSRRLARGLVMMLAVGALIASATAYAAKQPSYSPTLSVSWPLAAASTASSTGTPYTINGCGYDSSFGGVTVVVYSPTAAAWTGEMPDANGCISLSNGETQGSGTYLIQAWQHMGKKDVIVASTSFTA
jgi:hypothetical protein